MMFSGCKKSGAQSAFDEFMTTEHKESFIVAPLCGAGESVVPIVTEHIKDKNMERRLYAILFLGTTESKLSVPILQNIVQDETETPGYRSNALQSVYLLDENLGRKLAQNYQSRTDHLGKAAQEILQLKNHSDYKKRQKESICHPND